MNTKPQIESQEVNMQEHDVEALSDHSLPAAQVIEEQKDDVTQNATPRFIP
jgi:hypothetical protein